MASKKNKISSLVEALPVLGSWKSADSLICLVFLGAPALPKRARVFSYGKLSEVVELPDASVMISGADNLEFSVSFSLADSTDWRELPTGALPEKARRLLKDEPVEQALSFRLASGGMVILARLRA